MANVVFLWHMHQPYYVDPVTRVAMMPWVRLHCVKGYLDMISVIEDFPSVRVNFNLTPVLLLQVRELIDGEIRDLWLDWSKKPAASLTDEEKFSLLENFFKINWDHLVKPYPRFWELLNKRGLTFYRDDVRRGLRYFTEQEYLDLQVWFNLAWCGYTAFRLYPELQALRAKGRNFTEQEKNRLLEIHLEIMRLIIRKYRDAEERGQVELTTTPFYHPILPLVYDSAFAERSLPGRAFPERFHWPQDAAAHLTLAVAQHTALFGKPPRGLWPSEGSIAPELIPLLAQVGIEYLCSDEENLFNSLKLDPAYRGVAVDHVELFQGWRVHYDGAAVNAIFREKPLSDFIGFMAARNEPGEAASHLLHHLSHIAQVVPHEAGLIPLILDGENAWETFSDGGESFLRKLYGGLEADRDRLPCVTISDYFHHHPPHKHITTLHTGSWIGSNFDIWIGEEEENRAWDLLGRTRLFLQQQIDSGKLPPDRVTGALHEIYAAEGSDWFWWYGPDFSTENDDLFDQLFRRHLINVYLLCDAAPPADLDLPINKAKPVRTYELPVHLIEPRIDGRHSSFFEWMGAGSYEAGSEQGAMYRSDRSVRKILFGFGKSMLYLRIELAKPEPISLALRFHHPSGLLIKTGILTWNGPQPFILTPSGGEPLTRETFAAQDLIEWGILLSDLGTNPGETIGFRIQVLKDGIERESYPEHSSFQLPHPTPAFELQNWMV